MIHVFKTTVNTETQVQELKPYLDQLFPLSQWSFDLEDCDGIFRIETTQNKCILIQFLFTVCGFNCEELE